MRLITKEDVLAKAQERKYTSPVTVDGLIMGYDWYIEKYDIIRSAEPGSVLIDAGCKSGDWISCINHIIPKGVIRVGIDPIDYNSMQWNCDRYFKCALDDVDEPTTATFRLFDEPGCNSLLPKSDHLTMRNVTGEIQVVVRSLESILLELVAHGTIVSYMKCDCQGKDVAAIKSLRSFLPTTRYVQVECSFNANEPFYEGQPSYEDDVAVMYELGFEPIFWVEYPNSPLPEGEILFKNKNI